MNETTLISLSFLAFSGMIFLSMYLERKIEKKRKQILKKKKLGLMGAGVTVNKYHHEDFKERTDYQEENIPDNNCTENNLSKIDKTVLKIPGYYEEILHKEKRGDTTFSKLSSVENIDL